MNNEVITNATTYVSKTETVTNTDGLTYCIVRTYSAGVWAGYINFPAQMGEIVKEARRLYKWNSQFTLSELAIKGVSNSSECKFAIPVPQVGLTQVIEVIPCTNEAKASLQAVADYIP